PFAALFSFFFLMIPPPPRSTLFPYTTLFRSSRATRGRDWYVTMDWSRPRCRCASSAGHRCWALTRLFARWRRRQGGRDERWLATDRKSTRLNSSHVSISYAVFCLKKKKKK